MEKKQLKNWWLLTNVLFVSNKNKLLLIFICLFQINSKSQGVANYITNGGFEEHYNCNFAPYISYSKYWRTIDSINGGVIYASPCFSNVPNNGFGYQAPKSGNCYGFTDFLCQPPQCNPLVNRGYFRNRLKSKLILGKTYCVKLWVNLGNNSTQGITNVEVFFGDNNIDTITKCTTPLTYIIPQIQNSNTNYITDTLNWTLITGTFVANGTEKFCIIGNFKSDAATTKTLVNTTNLPTIGSTILIDDVSCIPTDLPAYAGPDIFGIPNNTVYIGRQRDVGIDEACTWYNLTNTTTPIANAAGITVTVATTTQTYMVKQDICGVIKYDTVTVYASAVGLVSQSRVEDWQVKVYPNPAKDVLNVEVAKFGVAEAPEATIQIINTLGQVIREEELTQHKIAVNVKDLPNGIYFFKIKSKEIEVNKKVVISK